MDPDQFLKKAKKLVIAAVDYKNIERVTPEGERIVTSSLMEEDLFIVWFCKTLGNWKALISTDKLSGLYWEVTYNGAKKEAYVDRYVKTGNQAISDEELE